MLVFFVYRRWQYVRVFHPKLYRETAFDERFRFLYVTTKEGIKLEGCVFEPQNSKATLLYFGGRGQDSVGLLPKLSKCYDECTIVTFNYRGYGKSEGKPSENALFEDGVEVYDKVVKNFGKVYVVGYSLGCSVASFVAMQRAPEKLFLIAGFCSMKTLVADTYGFVLPLLRFRFDTCAFLKKVTSQVYIFSSENDNVVAFANTKRLQKSVPNGTFRVFKGLDHVEILCDERVVDGIKTHI